MKFGKKWLALLLVGCLLLPMLQVETKAMETEEIPVEDRVCVDAEGFPEAEELFGGYLQGLFYGSGETATFGTLGRERLNLQGRRLYDYLKAQLEQVAAGICSATYFKIPGDQFRNWGGAQVYAAADAYGALDCFKEDFQISNVVSALLNDCPYDLYWFDKVSGVELAGGMARADGGYKLASMTFRFLVVADMRAANYNSKAPAFDTTRILAATRAADNAAAIADRYAALADYDKLVAFKNVICEKVHYDYSAAFGSFSADADPWQLIYVFDEDPSTNVVCEGYSKAFQYLCDLSDFRTEIQCRSVTGYLITGRGNEGHMWNIVTIGGKHYLADLTNSDAGTVGAGGGLFLAGGAGDIYGGYVVGSTGYSYDESTISLWGDGPDSILKLADKAYAPCTTHIYLNDQDPGCENCGELRVLKAVTTPMYRLYNPNSGEHFYTGSVQEKTVLVEAGWQYEGVAWNAPAAGGMPVYRLYNPNAGDHHYTMSEAERDMLIGVGWNYEGIAWFSATAENIPQYRLYNPNAVCGSHHYTGSKEECLMLEQAGWIYEGIGWFGMAN